MKIKATKLVEQEVEITAEELVEATIKAIEKDADLDGQWINKNGNLEYEVRISHSFYKEAGKPSKKQIEADKILKAVKAYRNKYLCKN